MPLERTGTAVKRFDTAARISMIIDRVIAGLIVVAVYGLVQLLLQ